jgi:integrase/recombinase XerD
MDKAVTISVYLDTRRKLQDGKYPVKIRVFRNKPRKQKLYRTKYAYTEDDFQKIWINKVRKKEYNVERLKLSAIENYANEVANKLTRFSFEAFERDLFSNYGNEGNVNSYYLRSIADYKSNNQLSTADLYQFSLASLLDYHGKDKLPFQTVTPKWLNGYERHMIDIKGRSKTTVSMYCRTLMAVFNNALEDDVIVKDEYPFGKRKYNIPKPKGLKKALTKEQLRILFEAKPQNDYQQKAKDFWFFSYTCNGMNFKDIAYLKYSNLSGEILKFSRAKTSSTDKDQAPVMVYLTDFAKIVIEKYGKSQKSLDDFIFSIVDNKETPDEQYHKLRNFVRFVNQHFLKFAKSAGVDEKVSTYWARHSFATNAIRSGASMEYVSEALSHSSLNTTRSYFAGFEDEEKKKIAKRLMEF